MHVHCWSLAAHSGDARNPTEDVSGRGLQEWLGIRGETRRCATRGGVGSLTAIPNANAGFPLDAPNDAGASLDEVVAHRDKVFEQQNLTALTDVLLANAGR